MDKLQDFCIKFDVSRTHCLMNNSTILSFKNTLKNTEIYSKLRFSHNSLNCLHLNSENQNIQCFSSAYRIETFPVTVQ